MLFQMPKVHNSDYSHLTCKSTTHTHTHTAPPSPTINSQSQYRIILEECNTLLASERKQFNISRLVDVGDLEHYGVCVASPERKIDHSPMSNENIDNQWTMTI